MFVSISIKSFTRIIFIAFFVISCESEIQLSSGIEGKVMRGPVNGGPEIIGQINDEPFSALFYVAKNSKTVAHFTTDENGEFSIFLPPGIYHIIPDEEAPIMMPQAQSKEVAVYKDSITSVVLDFDTGIR